MYSEIKETVYIAISAIVLSVVLGFVSIVNSVQRDIADVRNGQIISKNNVVQYKEYNKYDKKELIGEEVIECIRMFYDSGVTVYIESNIPLKKYNMETYMRPENRQYFSVKEGGALLNWFNSTKRYRGYLVYNSEDIEAKSNRMLNKYRLMPESISGTKEEKYNALDICDGEPMENSEVTGILIIDADLL